MPACGTDESATSLVDISVIVVTFNSSSTISGCLESIGAGAREVLVVDNASRDSTSEIVRRWSAGHPECNVRLVQNESNVGYGRAANIGLENAVSRFGLLINPDIRISREQLQQLRENAHVASVIAPDVVTESGESQQKFLDAKSVSQDVCFVPWVVGAIMLFDRERAPRFDENIFLFSEETELCHRLKQIAVIPSIRVLHESGTSSGSDPSIQYLKGWHAAWSKHYCRRKHGVRHSVLKYFLIKCLQWCICAGSARKRVKYGSRIAGTIAWFQGKSAFIFTSPRGHA